KAMGIQEQMVRSIAQREQSEASALAQTIQAAHYLQPTDKTIARLPVSSADADAWSKPMMQLLPNPANNQAAVQSLLPALFKGDKVIICNMYGQEVLSETLNEYGFAQLNTALLPAGIYYCSLWQNGKPAATQKLAIVR
ncbi:MAG TPA: T9SS type A sorting domain-containing protein, partial [Chitinophagales bacterium]|nr:T9SS type A sorting domain-containing protein [Chitinophagales bacterium]